MLTDAPFETKAVLSPEEWDGWWCFEPDIGSSDCGCAAVYVSDASNAEILASDWQENSILAFQLRFVPEQTGWWYVFLLYSCDTKECRSPKNNFPPYEEPFWIKALAFPLCSYDGPIPFWSDTPVPCPSPNDEPPSYYTWSLLKRSKNAALIWSEQNRDEMRQAIIDNTLPGSNIGERESDLLLLGSIMTDAEMSSLVNHRYYLSDSSKYPLLFIRNQDPPSECLLPVNDDN